MKPLSDQFFYNKGKVIAKLVVNTIVSVLLVTLGVYCFNRWELGFLFHDWKGYVILGVYGLFTLGMILSAVESFRKSSKANSGIPAFGVGPECFVVYDKRGLATEIPFEDCERVRFKLDYWLHGSIHILTLIIVYRNNDPSPGTERVEILLNELDRPADEIERCLKKIYHAYKKEHKSQVSPLI